MAEHHRRKNKPKPFCSSSSESQPLLWGWGGGGVEGEGYKISLIFNLDELLVRGRVAAEEKEMWKKGADCTITQSRLHMNNKT